MRLAQPTVQVQVIGSKEIGFFECVAKSRQGSTLLEYLKKLMADPQYSEVIKQLDAQKYIVPVIEAEEKKIEATAYIVLHESDVSKFVKDQKRLQKLLEDPDIEKLVKAKGL